MASLEPSTLGYRLMFMVELMFDGVVCVRLLEKSAEKTRDKIVAHIWRKKLRASRLIPIVADGMFSTRHVGSTARQPAFGIL